MSFTLEEIQAEAKRQLKLQAESEAAEKRLAAQQALQEALAKEERLRNERIRLLAEEEQVRELAKRLMIEAEAKNIATAKEAAIQKEIERLRNRSPLEILQDKVAELEESLREKPKSDILQHLEEKISRLEETLETQRQEKEFVIKTTQEALVDLHTQVSALQDNPITLDSVKIVRFLEQLVIQFLYLHKQTKYGNCYGANNHILHKMDSLIKNYKEKRSLKSQRKFIIETDLKSSCSFSGYNYENHALVLNRNLQTGCLEIKHTLGDQYNKKEVMLANIPLHRLGIQYELNNKYTLIVTFKTNTFQVSTPAVEGDSFGYGEFLSNPNNIPLEQLVCHWWDFEEVFE